MKGANIVDKNGRAAAYVGSFLVVRNPLFSFFYSQIVTELIKMSFLLVSSFS